ncbi:apolipoprotein D-like [Paramacrobiotus metropolitanus]|uniref:apolipoprotein D-like n=1 Tax=Paramacrobiotus metropolitanus TaxID=2943436 RepID=UPI002445F680|nr:apolipoprotein D-like [Paramacrobiotus metropolitanus]
MWPHPVNWLLLCTLAITTLLSNAQVGRVGKCPDMKGVPDFDFDRYANGTWYEIAKFFTIMETKCVSMEFIRHNQTTLVISNALEKMVLPPPISSSVPAQIVHRKGPGSVYKHAHMKKPLMENSKVFRQRRQSAVNQAEPIYTPIKIVGFLAEKVPPATLRFNYTEGTSMSEYRVLDTDYKTFAVIWSCNEMFNGVFHNQFVSILSRSRKADPNMVQSIVTKLTQAGIETAHIVAADQIRCDS